MKLAHILRILGVSVGFAILIPLASCGGGGVEGTYGEGQVKIELKSGGKATFLVMTESKDCTYTVDKKKINLDCKEGEPLALTLSDDGTTLMMPPGSMMPNMKKVK